MTKAPIKGSLATGGPEAIMPTTDFRADAWGDGSQVAFKAGTMSSPVPAAFAQKMRDEGKAEGKKSVPDKTVPQSAKD